MVISSAYIQFSIDIDNVPFQSFHHNKHKLSITKCLQVCFRMTKKKWAASVYFGLSESVKLVLAIV